MLFDFELPAEPWFRVHLLTNVAQYLEYFSSNYTTFSVSNFESSTSLLIFLASYKHNSVNPESYEKLCFWRWFILDEYISHSNQNKLAYNKSTSLFPIKLAFILDADVLITSDMSSSFFAQLRRINPLQLEAITFDSFATLWTGNGLRKWSEFILETFSDDEILSSRLEKYGETINGIRHISDMHLIRGWIQNNLTLRPHFEGDCSPVENIHAHQGQKLIIYKDIRKDSFLNGVPICFIHFAHAAKSRIVQFAEFFRMASNESTWIL